MSYPQHGHHQPDYSTLEVDDRREAQALPEVYQSPDNLPEVYDQNLPEVDAYQQDKYGHVISKYPDGYAAGIPGTAPATATTFSPASPYAATATTGDPPHDNGLIAVNEKQAEGKRICGLKKKTFIIALVVAIVVIIAIVAGVAGGVVSSQSNDDSSAASPASTTSPASPEATQDPNALSPDSQIAATSFTDGAGYTNHLVFYQLNNRQIHMASFNSSQAKWNVNPVVDGNSGPGLDEVAAGTPIAADLWADASISSTVWHLYWLSPTNVIMSLRLAFPSTENPPSPDDWTIAPASGYNIASTGSYLGSYARACEAPYCSQYSYLWWQKSDRSIDGIYLPPGGSWTDTGSASGPLSPAARTPSANSSISVANVRANADEGDWRALAIFYRGDDGGLGMINYERKSPEGPYFDGGRVGTGSQGRVVGEGTTILAFSTGTNGTQKGDDPLGFQVLTNDPEQADEGVMLSYYRNGQWGDGGEVKDLAACKSSNKMAVSQIDTDNDMVWCMVEGDDGKMQIRYFAWTQGATAKIETFGNYQDMGLVTIS